MKNLICRNFYIYEGKNGGVYVLNIYNWSTLTLSLNFYKAINLRSRFLKFLFKVIIFIATKFKLIKLKTFDEVKVYINSCTPNNLEIDFNKSSSILISPTKDKVIVNNNFFFQKYYFGKSFQKGNNDLNTYNLLKNIFLNFQISKCYDSKIHNNEIISFKLSNQHIDYTYGNLKTEKLVLILTEFFNISVQKKSSVKTLSENYKEALIKLSSKFYEKQFALLDQLSSKYGFLEISLGMVHGDFKPWNITNLKKPLIYDFEETIVNGLPLFDLFNYYISPTIEHEEPKKIFQKF